MGAHVSDIEHVLAALTYAPQHIQALTANIPAAQLYASPAPDAWSANYILAHLRASSDVWGKTITAMLTQDTPTLRYLSPRTWIRKTDYANQEFSASFQVYTQQRDALLQTLASLAREDWDRGAVIIQSGKERTHTVLDFAQRIVSHEAQHLTQIEALLHTMKIHTSSGS